MNTNYEDAQKRSGHIAIITALLLIVLIGMLAWAIDLGWIVMTKTQLHAAADSSSLAGGTEFLPGLGFHPEKTPEEIDPIVRSVAVDFAARNRAGDKLSVYVNSNRDILTGKARYSTTTGRWEFEWGGVPINAVRVTPRRDVPGGSGDEPLNLFFAPVLGTNTSNFSVLSTAVILPANGFHIPPGSPDTSTLLPFALKYSLWEKYFRAQHHFNYVLGSNPEEINEDFLDEDGKPLYFMENSGPGHQHLQRQLFDDAYTWSKAGGVTRGLDKILEMSIFPIDQTSGNFGTIDFGPSNNSASHLKRQIVDGVNDEDLSYFPDNTITASEDHPLIVNGDTGISGGIENSIRQIIGQSRSIALFTAVSEPGNNALFTVVRFAGVRIMDVELGGANKRLVIQPCNVSDSTGVPDYDTEIGENTTVFTALILAE